MSNMEYREYVQPIKKTTCECGCEKTQVFSLGRYFRARWYLIRHFCQKCFVETVQNSLVEFKQKSNTKVYLEARRGYTIPDWIKLPSDNGAKGYFDSEERSRQNRMSKRGV